MNRTKNGSNNFQLTQNSITCPKISKELQFFKNSKGEIIKNKPKVMVIGQYRGGSTLAGSIFNYNEQSLFFFENLGMTQIRV